MALIDVPEHRATALAPAGTTQADAALVKSKHALVASFTAGAGVKLQELMSAQFEWGTIFNGDSADAVLVYPWLGAAFNGRTANDPLTLPAGKGAMWVYLNATTLGVIYS
jgi:hypothetical protein